MLVEAFVAQSTVEAFDVGVLVRLSRFDETKLDAATMVSVRRRHLPGSLVRHTLDNYSLATRRGFTGADAEAFTYAFHHDGPSLRYGGLSISTRHVMPWVDRYLTVVQYAKELR